MKSLILTAVIALSAASAAAQTTFAGAATPVMSEVMTIMTPGGVMITVSTIREYRPPNIVYQVPEYRPAPPMTYENLPPTFSYSKPGEIQLPDLKLGESCTACPTPSK